MTVAVQNLINGELGRSKSNDIYEMISPFSGESLGTVTMSTPLDFVAALKAANAFQQPGKGVKPPDRPGLLLKLAHSIESAASELALLEARQLGTPYIDALTYDVRRAVEILRHWAAASALPAMSGTSTTRVAPAASNDSTGAAHASLISKDNIQVNKEQGESQALAVHTANFAYGIVGIISSRVWPLSDILLTLAPAVLSGASVIVKPATQSALVVSRLAEMCAQILPAGSVQFIFGRGTVIGELIASHPGVDFVSFSGRTETGQKVAGNLSQQLKPCALRLSAKNSALVLDDADLAQVSAVLTQAAFSHCGQTPESISRVMISESRHDQFVEALTAQMQLLQFDDPTRESTSYGYLWSSERKTDVVHHINTAVGEKGLAVAPLAIDHPAGVGPTLIRDLHNCSDLHQLELLAPVLLVVPTKYTHESIKWANTTPFGQSAVIFGSDEGKMQRAAAQMQVEHVWLNNWQPQNEYMLSVGHKQSGWGSVAGALSPLHRTTRIH
jgi:acyl-CoA reductase-like NAD-dependent aldehyde dehydrogenase